MIGCLLQKIFNVLYIIIQRPLHNMNISPVVPPSPYTNFNQLMTVNDINHTK